MREQRHPDENRGDDEKPRGSVVDWGSMDHFLWAFKRNYMTLCIKLVLQEPCPLRIVSAHFDEPVCKQWDSDKY